MYVSAKLDDFFFTVISVVVSSWKLLYYPLLNFCCDDMIYMDQRIVSRRICSGQLMNRGFLYEIVNVCGNHFYML